MAKTSRQRRKTIRVSEIRALSELQVTDREAAAFFGISLQTFREMIRVDSSAREAWEDGRQLGRISLRKNQFALSRHNASMAQWLGKQYLDQKDVQQLEMSGRDGEPIKMLDLGRLSKEQRGNLREILTLARAKTSGR